MMLWRSLRQLSGTAWCVVTAVVPATVIAQGAPELDGRVDSIFVSLTGKSPGCAVAASRNGATLFARAYGMASLELAVPNTPETVFDIGSVSKQFTAAVVLMLARDGKLSLDASVRRYLPELPPWAAPITLRHLLTQTSGVRDYLDLLPLSGVQFTSVVTAADAMAMLVRQRALNFAPGDAFAYSNSNYFLLSQVIERVTGDSLSGVLQRRIFAPLGMTSTVLRTSHAQVVPGAASSYEPASSGGGFQLEHYDWETTGDGAIQSTVLDLLRWADALAHGAVGGPELWSEITDRPRLSDGTRSPYAMGLFTMPLRGMPRFEHNGVAAGYRADISIFPEQHLATALLCNHGGVVPTALAQRLADVLLPPDATPAAPANGSGTTGVADPPPAIAHPERYTGTYFSPSSGVVIRLLMKGDELRVSTGGPGRVLRLTKPGELAVTGTPFVLVVRDSAGERVLDQRRADAPTTRFVLVPDTTTLDRRALAAYAGRYWSDELGSAWVVAATDSGLVVRREGLAATAEPAPQQFRDAFGGGFYVIRFDRDRANAVTGFHAWTRGVRGIAFRRVRA